MVGLVFIIDDDKIYRYATERYIQILNLANDVRAYSDGQEALNYIKQNSKNVDLLPDVIFLDINMPLMDGWDFVDEYLKIQSEMPKDIKLYMVSSSIDERDRVKALNINEVADYVVKPISEEKLKSLISRKTA